MSKRNRQRGFELEREAVHLGKEFDVPAKRAYGSNGEALGETKEVDVLLGVLRISCKRKRKLPKWLQRPVGVDAMVFREDKEQPLIQLPLRMFLEFVCGTRPLKT